MERTIIPKHKSPIHTFLLVYLQPIGQFQVLIDNEKKNKVIRGTQSTQFFKKNAWQSPNVIEIFFLLIYIQIYELYVFSCPDFSNDATVKRTLRPLAQFALRYLI